MLSQDERRRFNAIAHQLTTDREFVRQTQLQVPAEARPLPVSALCAVLYLLVPILVVLGGRSAVLPALGVLVVAVVLHGRHRATRGR